MPSLSREKIPDLVGKTFHIELEARRGKRNSLLNIFSGLHVKSILRFDVLIDEVAFKNSGTQAYYIRLQLIKDEFEDQLEYDKICTKIFVYDYQRNAYIRKECDEGESPELSQRTSEMSRMFELLKVIF